MLLLQPHARPGRLVRGALSAATFALVAALFAAPAKAAPEPPAGLAGPLLVEVGHRHRDHDRGWHRSHRKSYSYGHKHRGKHAYKYKHKHKYTYKHKYKNRYKARPRYTYRPYGHRYYQRPYGYTERHRGAHRHRDRYDRHRGGSYRTRPYSYEIAPGFGLYYRWSR